MRAPTPTTREKASSAGRKVTLTITPAPTRLHSGGLKRHPGFSLSHVCAAKAFEEAAQKNTNNFDPAAVIIAVAHLRQRLQRGGLRNLIFPGRKFCVTVNNFASQKKCPTACVYGCKCVRFTRPWPESALPRLLLPPPPD